MTREQVVEAIRDPIMLFLEREFHMIATVESDRLADMLADLLMPVVEREKDQLVAAASSIADLHHRTVTGARGHDPEHVESFRDWGRWERERRGS